MRKSAGGSCGFSLREQSAEKVFHLSQQTARSGFALDMHGVAELAQQVALGFGELLWRLHHNLHHQVSSAMFVQMRNTLTTQAKLLARLRAFMNAQGGVSFERRYLN